MISGVFIGNIPLIQLTLSWGSFAKNYWFTLDTGFTGDLQVPISFASELGLKVNSVEPFTIANGQTVNVPQALGVVSMEGLTHYVQIGISDGSPLAGISFLKKFSYCATVDAKHSIVALHKT